MSPVGSRVRKAVSAVAATTSIDDIPGWFDRIDQVLFAHFLETSVANAAGSRGDLVELGAFMGKSAVLIGAHRAADEVFTVCDLFGTPASEDANERENAASYATLDRAEFERNYLAIHDRLPVIVQDFTSTITDHVRPGSVRFMHIDASHLYAHVAADARAARRLLLPDGVVVFDDYRSAHTPGVAAAVWEAVVAHGLRPICATPAKLYATYGDPEPLRPALVELLSDLPRVGWEVQDVAGTTLVRVNPSARYRYTARLRVVPHQVKGRLRHSMRRREG